MFIQPGSFDPIEPGVGTNRYAYSGNDPINQRDPSGNSFLDWFSSREDSDHQNQQAAASFSSYAIHLENQGVLENPHEEVQRQQTIAKVREATGWYQNRVGVSLQVLQQELVGQFSVVAGQAQIERMMLNAGNGSRGDVGGTRANTEGHVFNVVNQNGTVRFLDGQTGGAATFSSDYVAYVFMRTN